MSEPTQTVKEAMEGLVNGFTELAAEAETRRKAASAKWELYKVEFSAGEKNAYENAAKKIKAALAKL